MISYHGQQLIQPHDAERLGFALNVEELKWKDGEFKTPKSTGKAYKLFQIRDGKLYPVMVANPDGADTPIGEWVTANVPEIVAYTLKEHRPKIYSGGKYTRACKGFLSFRPGWHLDAIPYAKLFLKRGKVDGKYVWDTDLVWTECEYTNEIDYTEESNTYGYDFKNTFRHPLAGLLKIPKNGYYIYRSNPNDKGYWIITGAIKVNRILSNDEVNEILKENDIDIPLVMSKEEYLERVTRVSKPKRKSKKKKK